MRPKDIFFSLLRKVEIFKDGDSLFLSQVKMALRSKQVAPGGTIIREGDIGREMYLLARGEVEVTREDGHMVNTLKEGDFFGEIALLLSTPRIATVSARTACDLLVLDKAAFQRILQDHQQFAEGVAKVARDRYHLDLCARNLADR